MNLRHLIYITIQEQLLLEKSQVQHFLHLEDRDLLCLKTGTRELFFPLSPCAPWRQESARYEADRENEKMCLPELVQTTLSIHPELTDKK